VNILVEDLMDASLGSLGGELRDGAAAPASQQQSQVTDFELSQICLVPTSDWDATIFGIGNRYDVYDGQQRLVTLNLILAALRDSFQIEAKKSQGGKRGVALEATANEIAGMLRPTKVRKQDVLRITLRKRDNILLEQILSLDDDNDEKKEDTIIPVGETPTSYLSNLSTKQKNALLAPLSTANTRIFENFLHISERLSLLSTRERLRLLDYIVERVYLLVCIPETSRIARNIVMSQGRKGMDNEAIDDFKGLVCFRYTLDEQDMYQTFDRWDTLSAEPSTIVVNNENLQQSAEDASSSEFISSVGRETIAAACVLRASAILRTKIRSGGGDEVYEWERWLRHVLWVQNQKLADINGTNGESAKQSWQGKDFFAECIQPASVALFKFRMRQWEEFSFLLGKNKKEKNTIISRLNFLKDIIGAAASAKEAEILVLELLLRAEEAANKNDKKMLSWLLEFLPSVEKISLWMALTRPSPMQRHNRVFELLDAINGDSREDIEADDIALLRTSSTEYKFGASASGRKLAAAILCRLNCHLMMKDGAHVSYNKERTVDLILPEQIPKGSEWEQAWTEEEHESWVYSLGNLALTTQTKKNKKTKGTDSTSCETKMQEFKKETWPLTRALSESVVWNVEAVTENQKRALSLMEEIWMN